jgi:2-(1,2-epoxy-1,2-dihydrophenyl)acetyl-CoA isomerase
MLGDMASFLRNAQAIDTVQCLVLTGAGDQFIAGGDLTRFAAALDQPPADRAADFSQRVGLVIPVFEAIEALTKPLVARIRGAAAGAAIGWVAPVDFVIGSDTASFSFAHSRIGLRLDGALSYYLPRLVGTRKVKQLGLFGGSLDAQQSLAIDLVNCRAG